MNLPVEVIEAVNEGRCLLFVGSRFSSEAAEEQGRDYPDSKTLAKALGWKRPRRLMGTRARPVKPSVREGAAIYQAERGRPQLITELRQRLGARDVQPAAWHKSALSRFPVIFTTVWDDLLERAAAEMGGEVEVRYRGDEAPVPDRSKRVIYKLNGGFERPETLILTQADRERVPWPDDVKKAIRRLIRGYVILFVGYWPDDEEFEAVFDDLSQCYGGELPRCHLAVAQGRIDDVIWQKWVWRGLLMFTADPSECMSELEARIDT